MSSRVAWVAVYATRILGASLIFPKRGWPILRNSCEGWEILFFLSLGFVGGSTLRFTQIAFCEGFVLSGSWVFSMSRHHLQRPPAPFISTRPRRLTTVRTGVFLHRRVRRFSSREVGMAIRTRSDRERATATCEARTPRIFTSTFVPGPLTLDKTETFPTVEFPKHQQLQVSGSSDIAMHPHPFLQVASHPPAEHFAIAHPLS
jgi:hypothetical protein